MSVTLTFAFIALLNGNTYVMDSDLSLEDCGAELVKPHAVVQVDSRTWVGADGATFACVLDSRFTLKP